MCLDDEQKECESKVWWDDIRRLAENLERAFNKKGNENSIFVQLDEQKLDLALKTYERSWWTFKTFVYREKAEEECIDRHKIISLYILAILAIRPFEVRAHSEKRRMVYLENANPDNRDLFLANELFSFAVMQVLIFAWDKNKGQKIFKINDNEKLWFVILLNNIKLHFENMKVSFISSDAANVINILSLAQIVYYIERSYTPKLSPRIIFSRGSSTASSL